MTADRPQDPDLRLVVVPDESEECARRRARLQALRERMAAGRSDVNSSDLPAGEGDSLSGNSSRPDATALLDATEQDRGGAKQEA